MSAPLETQHRQIFERVCESHRLTPRDRDVAALLLTGASKEEIADTLYIQGTTVGNAIGRINQALGTANQLQIALVLLGAMDAPIRGRGTE